MGEVANKPKLYKVLLNGASFHGGNLNWSLPKEDGTPGDWHEVNGKVSLCRRGLHVTRYPGAWWTEGAECYEAETDGECVDDGADKVACQRVRLVRKLAADELPGVGVFIGGASGEWKGGPSWLSGNATATLFDNATATLSGNATATLYDNATATLYGNATATLYGNATATLFGNATATLFGNATATLFDNATATLFDNATATIWQGNPSVRLEHYAVLIDRRDGKPVMHAAPYATPEKAK